MPYDLIATLVVGGFAAFFVWAGFRARRRPVPRHLLPIVVGLAMIGYAVWSEYTWWWRTRDALPAGIEVIETLPETSVWRPWTLVVPRVTRMIAIDRTTMRRNERLPGVVLVDLVLLERLVPARKAARLIDCANARAADAGDPAAFAEDGLPAAAAWSPLRPEASLFRAVCIDAAGS